MPNTDAANATTAIAYDECQRFQMTTARYGTCLVTATCYDQRRANWDIGQLYLRVQRSRTMQGVVAK
jgi:hypothetical protein